MIVVRNGETFKKERAYRSLDGYVSKILNDDWIIYEGSYSLEDSSEFYIYLNNVPTSIVSLLACQFTLENLNVENPATVNIAIDGIYPDENTFHTEYQFTEMVPAGQSKTFIVPYDVLAYAMKSNYRDNFILGIMTSTQCNISLAYTLLYSGEGEKPMQ